MTFLNQPLAPPDGCDECGEYHCICDRWGDDIDKAYDEWRGK